MRPMNERSTSLVSLGATRVAICVVGALAPLFAVGLNCTSSSDDVVPEDASLEATQPAMPQQEAGGGTHPEAGAVGMDTGHPTGPSNEGGGPADAGTGANDANKKDAAATSDACAQYCACYEKKCSVFVAIPTGQDCPDFCATFVDKDGGPFACRFNMCFYNSSGPATNNNNHCQHTVGIDECL